MFGLAELVLKTTHAAGSGPTDPITLFRQQYPKIPLTDVAAELTALAAEGLLEIDVRKGVCLTPSGLAKLVDHASAPSLPAPYDGAHDASPSKSRSLAPSNELSLEEIIELLAFEVGEQVRPTEVISARAIKASEDELKTDRANSITDEEPTPATPMSLTTLDVDIDVEMEPGTFGGLDTERTRIAAADGDGESGSHDLPGSAAAVAAVLAERISVVERQLARDAAQAPAPDPSEQRPPPAETLKQAPQQAWGDEHTEVLDDEAFGVEHIADARRNVEQLINKLNGATDIAVDVWAQALEVTRQIEAKLNKLEDILRPKS